MLYSICCSKVCPVTWPNKDIKQRRSCKRDCHSSVIQFPWPESSMDRFYPFTEQYRWLL